MGTLPTIDQCFRVTFNFRAGSAPVYHNVMHFSNATGTAADIASNINDALATHYPDMFKTVPTNYGVSDLDIIPLFGDLATQNFPISNHGGQASGQSIPNTACIVRLRSGERGRSARGRVFLGPVAESAVQDGFLSVDAGDIAAGWAAFQTDMIADNGTAQVIASYKLASMLEVFSYDVPVVLGTQRRRQERLH